MAAETATRRKGGGAQLRAHKGKLTAAARADFLAELARTMNVRLSAQAIEVSEQAVYALRKRDAAFAEGWAAALSDAYERVEMLLLERAIAGLDSGGDAAEAGDTAHFEKLAERTLLGMLGHHRQAVQTHRAALASARERRLIEGEATAKARLERKLDEMERRLRGTPAGDPDGGGES